MIYQLNPREQEILSKTISAFHAAKDKLEAIVAAIAAAHNILPPFDVLPDGSGLQTPEPVIPPKETSDATDTTAT